MLPDFVNWLASTRASAMIQNVTWIIPAVQSIHILTVCVVMSSVLLLNLRLVGVIGGGEPADAFTRRYLPWVWIALGVLLTTGAILIVGEPNRDMNNPTFWNKMILLGIAVTLTLILEQPVLHNATFWEGRVRRPAARVLATAALLCWVGIVLAGRWIAYTY
jgi:hypothetical protein